MAGISGQSRSREEDLLNKPWRPLPAGRITGRQAIALRWVFVVIGLGISVLLGHVVAVVSLGLVIATIAHNDLGYSCNLVHKNVWNAVGYMAMELGTTALMGTRANVFSTREMLIQASPIRRSDQLDSISMTAIYTSAILVLTTVQSQDFADVDGDKKLGRITFPIYAPELSRTVTFLATTAWSLFLGPLWDIGPTFQGLLSTLGTIVGVGYLLLRTPGSDKVSYVLYNVSPEPKTHSAIPGART